ncbi:MAG: response regulator [Myxococcota bacterium]|jgi:DNA-binding NtrC family response regulator|nr:response regulator [Myxococcota bacterium]
MPGVVLVVDDRARPRRALAHELEDAGYAVVEAQDGVEGWRLFGQHQPDVVVSDMVMPRSDGLELLNRIRASSDIPVLLFTARGSIESAASAFKAGADDFVASSDVTVEDLVSLVDRAVAGNRPSHEHTDLAGRLIGSSDAMRRVRERVSALAPLRTPVLVCGEQGTGRDSVVSALHELGSTAQEDFATFDCANFEPGGRLPATGAIYLDGVEALSPTAQRYWGERVARSVSDNLRDPVRLFASASERFVDRVRSGAFESDLAAVLLRIVIELTPLRERSEDVPELADALTRRATEHIGRQVRLSPAAKATLSAYPWRQNCVGLARVIERCVAFSRGRTIRRQLVQEILSEDEPSIAGIREQNTLREREEVIHAIESTGGNVSRAARKLGRSRGAIYRLIERHGIPLTETRR